MTPFVATVESSAPTRAGTGPAPAVRRADLPARRATIQVPRGAALILAALLSGGVAAAELLAVPLAAAPWLGGVLAALAIVQLLAGAMALIRPTRRVLLTAGAITLALLADWALSRWTGLLLGPNLWLAEDRRNGDTDLVRAVPQALTALLFLGLGAWPPRRQPRRLGVALRAVPAVLLAAILTFASLPGGSVARTVPLAPVAPGEMATFTYCTSGGVPLAMDVYAPTAAAPRPAPTVLFVHGGGWIYGDRNSDAIYLPYRQLVAELTARGFVVASIDYRLASLYPFPAPIVDAKCAVRFLRANAATLGIDPGRIGAFGGSAGGGTVALLGMRGTPAAWDAGQYQGYSSAVQAVVDFSGLVDMTPSGGWEAQSLLGRLIGQIGLAGQSPAARRAASAVAHAAPGEPPFFIGQGTSDPIVPPAQGQELARRLRAAGVPTTLVLVPGAGHVNDPLIWQQFPTAINFLAGRLG